MKAQSIVHHQRESNAKIAGCVRAPAPEPRMCQFPFMDTRQNPQEGQSHDPGHTWSHPWRIGIHSHLDLGGMPLKIHGWQCQTNEPYWTRMKYLPTIDLIAPGVQEALISGRLKLQRGQWVLCCNRKPSRYVGLTRGKAIWAVHPSPDQESRFREICSFKNRK